jgi:hypothetical protein
MRLGWLILVLVMVFILLFCAEPRLGSVAHVVARFVPHSPAWILAQSALFL